MTSGAEYEKRIDAVAREIYQTIYADNVCDPGLWWKLPPDVRPNLFRESNINLAYRQARAADAAVLKAIEGPTERMLGDARDWSILKYGKGIGNDGAAGCWRAMWAAASRSTP